MKKIEDYFNVLRRNEAVNRFISEYGGQLKKIAIIVVLIIVVSIVLIVKGNDTGVAISKEGEAIKSTESQITTIYVDIGGAVNTPMLAELPEGSRVEDAILEAGGLTEEADLTSINRAEFLEDGEKIYIPFQPENTDESNVSISQDSSATASLSSGKVNINTADSTALQTLNGVGPVTAQKIIDYRNSNGRFKNIEDIKNVSGIGDKTFEKLKDFITP